MNPLAPDIAVLLVEDNPTDALLIQEALREVTEFCPQLVHVERVSDAVLKVQTSHVDVVLLDLALPDGQGLDTFRRFHSLAPSLPVVVLTGLEDTSVGVQAIHEGAQDYLLKRNIGALLLARTIRYAMERHRVAGALAASEERFQLAVSGASAGLWDWDPQTDAMYMSSQFKAIIGYEEDELPNERSAHWGAIHPNDAGRVSAALEAHLARRSGFDVEYRIRTKSAGFRWVQSRGQALWDDSGTPHRMVGWLIDITDRKNSEEALRASREELQRLTAYIQEIREEEKARVARELHEGFGQQLTALKLAVNRIGQDFQRPDAGATELARSLHAVYPMIDNLIESVRQTAAHLRPAMLDDLGLVAAIDWLANDFIARSGIRLSSHIEVEGIAFNRESRVEVFRIVQESLTNVIRHSGASEVTLEIVCGEPNCIVRIADNGRGAAPDAVQGSRSLGLIGLRERAARFGGEIQVRTAPGAGFEVIAILPLAGLVTGE